MLTYIPRMPAYIPRSLPTLRASSPPSTH